MSYVRSVCVPAWCTHNGQRVECGTFLAVSCRRSGIVKMVKPRKPLKVKDAVTTAICKCQH